MRITNTRSNTGLGGSRDGEKSPGGHRGQPSTLKTNHPDDCHAVFRLAAQANATQPRRSGSHAGPRGRQQGRDRGEAGCWGAVGSMTEIMGKPCTARCKSAALAMADALLPQLVFWKISPICSFRTPVSLNTLYVIAHQSFTQYNLRYSVTCPFLAMKVIKNYGALYWDQACKWQQFHLGSVQDCQLAQHVVICRESQRFPCLYPAMMQQASQISLGLISSPVGHKEGAFLQS